jgi:hypothetical protein
MTLDSPGGAGTALTVLLTSPKKIIHPNGPGCILPASSEPTGDAP